LLVDLFCQLSKRTKWLRYHWREHKFTDEEILQQSTDLCNVDWQHKAAIIAVIIEEDGQEHAVGAAHVVRENVEDTEAEGAIVVRDDFQSKGLGKYLFRALAERAKQMGITHVFGWVMPENVYLMKFVRRLGVEVESKTEYGERKVRVKL
jgi:acetyltransferase